MRPSADRVGLRLGTCSSCRALVVSARAYHQRGAAATTALAQTYDFSACVDRHEANLSRFTIDNLPLFDVGPTLLPRAEQRRRSAGLCAMRAAARSLCLAPHVDLPAGLVRPTYEPAAPWERFGYLAPLSFVRWLVARATPHPAPMAAPFSASFFNFFLLCLHVKETFLPSCLETTRAETFPVSFPAGGVGN